MPHWCRRRPAALLVMLAPATAAAQGAVGPESVRSTGAPNSERRGIRTGPVATYLSVGVRGRYNDNIYAESSDASADYIAHVRPRVHVRTRSDRHGAQATVEADAARHLRNPAADVVAYGGRTKAHLDLGPTTRLGVELAAQKEHEDPAAPGSPGGVTRTPIRRYAMQLDASTRLGPLGLALAGGVERLNFGDVRSPADSDDGNSGESDSDDSDALDNDDRDRVDARAAARASYRLSPAYQPFIQGAYNLVTYDQTTETGLDRDGTGFEVGAGLRYRPNGFTAIEGRLGYRTHNLADDELGAVEGLTAELALRSNLTPHTTLDVSGSRGLRITTVRSAAGYTATRIRSRLDHRLRRHLLLGADVSVARHRFVSSRQQRSDTLLGAGVEARYDPSAFLRLTADYRFTRRLSTADAAFVRNQVTLGAELHY